jgi:hypothetical protein
MPTVPNQPTGEAAEPAPVSRAHLTLIVSGLVRAGANAPVRTEFTELPAGRELEVQLADGDRHTVDVFAKMFDLPTPAASSWVTTRALQTCRAYGSTSLAPSFGWKVHVHCLIDASKDRAIGTAHVPVAPPLDGEPETSCDEDCGDPACHNVPAESPHDMTGAIA